MGEHKFPNALGRFNLQYTNLGQNNFIVTTETGDAVEGAVDKFVKGKLGLDAGWRGVLDTFSNEVRDMVSEWSKMRAEWAGSKTRKEWSPAGEVGGFLGPPDIVFTTSDGTPASKKYEVLNGKAIDQMAYIYAAEGEPPLSVPAEGEEAWHPRVDHYKEHILLAVGGFAFWSKADEFG